MKIAIVGCGTVGGSWAVVFARAGFDVSLYDPSPSALEAASAYASQAVADLASQQQINPQCTDGLLCRIKPAASLAEAVGEAEYIQESAPERLAIKQRLYEDLAALAEPNAIIASSSSGFPASSFTEQIRGRERCLIVHPINPPHLIPLVEIVPAPWTFPGIVEQAEALMKQIGQTPIRLKREIPGFVVNRLQSAILAEAFRLVEDGVCSANDVDAAVAEGLGLRWCFMGPFETIDLNAQGGISDYCQKLGPMYYDLAREQADPRQWSQELINTVESERRERTLAEDLDKRKIWRDRCLRTLAQVKAELLKQDR